MKIVIYIYEGLTVLDAIGPYEVLRNLSKVDIKFVAKQKGSIRADSHFVHLEAQHDISEIKEADILIIPSSTIGFVREMRDATVLDWIKEMDRQTKRTVTVCTGWLILATTRLLEGKKATSHWKTVELLADFGVTPFRERIVEQGKYISSAGVSAGIDMALHLKGDKSTNLSPTRKVA